MVVGGKDRRRAPRSEVNAQGLIIGGEGDCVLACVIRNVSILGAMVEAPEADVPERFFLVDLVGSVAYEAELVWRRAGRVGLRFADLLILSEERTPAYVRDAVLQHWAGTLAKRHLSRQLARS
jgi:hypothetical protein